MSGRRRQTITLKRPEGGAEHGVMFHTRHGCSAGNTYRLSGESELEDADTVTMPVGLFGWEMPSGVPFEVTSMHPCGACGATVKGMFQWAGAKVFLP